MRKISFFGGVAVLVLIGVGAWIAVGTSSSTSALAAYYRSIRDDDEC